MPKPVTYSISGNSIALPRFAGTLPCGDLQQLHSIWGSLGRRRLRQLVQLILLERVTGPQRDGAGFSAQVANQAGLLKKGVNGGIFGVSGRNWGGGFGHLIRILSGGAIREAQKFHSLW
jgi:hypothetical protein